MERFLNAVAEKITTDWKRLGRELEIPEALLSAIGVEYSKTQEKAYQTLLKWYRNLGNSNATKEVLFEALRKIRRTLEAEELEKEYGIPADVKRRPWSEVIIRCYPGSSLEPTEIKKSKTVPQIGKPRLNLKHINREDKEFRPRSGAFSGKCAQSKIEIIFPSPVIQPEVEEDESSECSQSSQNKLQNSAGNCSRTSTLQLNVPHDEQDINTNPNQTQAEKTPQIVIQLNLTQQEIQSRHPHSAECPQPNQSCSVEIPLPIISLDMVEENTCAECSKTKQNNANMTYPTIIVQLQFQEQDGNSSNEILKSVHCYQKVSEDLVEKQPEDTTPYKQDGVDNDH